MLKRARPRLLKSTRDNVNSYQAKQYIGPRIFCFNFFKNFFFLLYFILFLSVLFFLPFLTFFVAQDTPID